MPELTLTIVFNTDTGKIGVNGPIQDKVGCFGVLEVAKDAIREYHRAQEENRVQPVSVVPPGLMANLKTQ